MRKWNFHYGYLACLALVLLSSQVVRAQEEDEYENAEVLVEAADSTVFNLIDPNTVNRVELRQVPGSSVDRVRSDEAFWYANAEIARKKQKPREADPGLLDQKWFKGLVWFLIIAAFLVIIITFLASSNVSLFRRASKKQEKKPEDDDDSLQEDIFSIDYETEIARAQQQQNFRRAIRYHYLQTLRDLSLQERIRYSPERTDRDYVFQLAGTPFYRGFFGLTRSFEYAWYGKFPVEADTYQRLQKDFLEFKNGLAR